MARISHPDDDTVDSEEAAKFNSETHILFSKHSGIFNLSFASYCVCFTADNRNFNINISKCTGKAFIGCMSHKLNMKVNNMLSTDIDLHTTVHLITNRMNEAKGKLKTYLLFEA